MHTWEQLRGGYANAGSQWLRQNFVCIELEHFEMTAFWRKHIDQWQPNIPRYQIRPTTDFSKSIECVVKQTINACAKDPTWKRAKKRKKLCLCPH